MIQVGVTNQQQDLHLEKALTARMRRAVRQVLRDASIEQALISLAVVDDSTIQRLNQQFLGHDEPTDVISFVLEQTCDRLEGEIVVSGTTALGTAPDIGWSPADELLLYVVHGALHLVGYDDRTPEQRRAMRDAETRTLNRLGVTTPGPRSRQGTPLTGATRK